MRQRGKGISLECIESNAAGIDVGSTEVYVAVPEERDSEPVRCFKTFTEDLRQMAAWLRQCHITTVAMESTGVYWLPPYAILEEAGIRVCLVNSKHVKHVPGRKSGVEDCQWLPYLHSVGLLHASFRPDEKICAIRALSRHRASPIEAAAVHVRAAHPSVGRQKQFRSPAARLQPQDAEAPKNRFHRAMGSELKRVLGVDLTTIPGISELTAHTLLDEIGPNLSRFPNVAAFASWLALCPANKKSGGKVLSSKTRQSNSRALRIAAQTLARSRSHLGNFYRRMRARLGAPQAITATAHKLARIVYHLIATGQDYDESVFRTEEHKQAQRHEKRLRKQAKNLGFQLVPIAA